MAILSRRVIRRNYCLAIRLDQFLLESGATLNPENIEDGWLHWQEVRPDAGVPVQNAYWWLTDGHHYVPAFTLKPGKNELDLYLRWRQFESYFRLLPNLWVALRVDPEGNRSNCRYHYVGPYVTAEHRCALNNLIIERDGFEMFQVLTALLPPPTATLVCLNDSLSLAAWRLPAGQLAYNRYLLDSRGGYPIPNPDPRVTYLVSISPTMQACMAPFDAPIP